MLDARTLDFDEARTRFDRDGVVIVSNVLSADELKEVRETIAGLIEARGVGLIPLRRRADDRLCL